MKSRCLGSFKALKLMLGIFILLAANETLSQIRYEQELSDHDARWSQSGSRVSCTLSYALTGYGRADFTMYSGPQKRLAMELFPLVSIQSPGVMRIISAPPPWRHGDPEREIGRIKLYPAFNPFTGDTVSWRMLTALESGFEILLPYRDSKRYPHDTVVPSLSPMGFLKPYADFLDCSQHLINVAYADAAMTAVLFKEGGVTLQPGSQKALADQILYVSHDPAVNAVSITAFAFERGSSEANQALAMQRANFLKQEFINSGFDGEKITVHAAEDEGGSTILGEERVFAPRAIIRLDRDAALVDPDREALMPDIGLEGAALP